jgi:hypothetical protein
MLLKLTLGLGRDRTIIGIIAMNGTGSDILTLFDTDLLALGNTQGYHGWLGRIGIMDATGTITFPLADHCSRSTAQQEPHVLTQSRDRNTGFLPEKRRGYLVSCLHSH